MGSNFHTPFTSATHFLPEEMNVPLASIDKALTYLRNTFFHCDGIISWDAITGRLAWSDTLRLVFTTAAGNLVQNTAAAGYIDLTDGQAAYVDASETDGATMTVTAATLTTGAASTIAGVARFVLGIRNAASDAFYPCWLRGAIKTVDLAERTVTLSGSVTALDLLYLRSAGDYAKASAESLTMLQNIVCAKNTGSGSGIVYERGVVGGFSGLTPGGAVYVQLAEKAVKTITVSSNPAANDTLVVGGKTYTFVTGTPSTDQIQIGADAAATATNIATQISTDTATTLCTATAASEVVTATANNTGTDFACSQGTGATLTIATTTANVNRGQITQTAPTTTGKFVKCVGWALSATTIYFAPDTLAIQI